MNESLSRKSFDNVTVLMISFNDFEKHLFQENRKYSVSTSKNEESKNNTSRFTLNNTNTSF